MTTEHTVTCAAKSPLTSFLLATHPHRAQDPFDHLADAMASLTYLHVPMIETRLVKTPWPTHFKTDPPAWVFFTSAAAVGAFIQCFGPTRLLASRLAAVGQKTAEALTAVGLQVDFYPQQSNGAGAEHAARQFLAEIPRPLFGRQQAATILWPCAVSALSSLAETLQEEGWQVHALPLYETHPATVLQPQKQSLLKNWRHHWRRAVMFTSPSAVTSTSTLFQELGLLLDDATCLVIGETTARALLQKHPASVVKMAPYASLKGLWTLVTQWQHS
ncbi:MAG: uroporphyrinogen-III synthase [Vampirovibrionales bacterium]|nr:uroporphyrinogen-III synthase [Vampirovibrionales bacterium]